MLRCHRLVLLLAAGLLTGPAATSQTRALDSLRRLVASHPQADTTRVRRLQALAVEVSKLQPAEAITLTKQALALARRIADPVGEGLALLRLGTLYRRQADYNPALRYTQQAKALFTRRADRAGLSNVYMQLSLIYMVQGSPVPAMQAALKGLHLAEQVHDQQAQVRLRVTLGNIYNQLGDYRSAVLVLQLALRDADQIGDERAVASALNVLGNSYQQQHRYQPALASYQRAIALNRKLGDSKSEAIDEIDVAELYEEQGRQALALQHGQRARQLARTGNDVFSLPAAELILARVYLALNQPDSAIALARHGLQLSQQHRNNENIRNASEVLARAYSARGDSARAFKYLGLHVAYKDTLSGEEVQRQTSALRYGFELDKKQQQIALLTKTRQLQAQKSARQRQQLYALLAGLGGLLVVAALLWRNVVLKQRTNRQLNEHNEQIARQRDNLDRTLHQLQAAQRQLVQREKMASLGELTAGVAHEIQNPLNFVNNFAELSGELLAELRQELDTEPLPPARRATISALLQDLDGMQQKIATHGHRADSIVKGMLEHSRASTGQRRPTDLNALVEEYLRLSYHGLRAKNKSFNALITTHLDPGMGTVEVVPQDLSRVLLNLFTNAFYAVTEKQQHVGSSYQPQVKVYTCRYLNEAEIRIHDNGLGISSDIIDKVFQPFFTTKPPGAGTGLGLSLSYDIVTQVHGGTLTVNTQEGEFAEFVVRLPLHNSSNWAK
ncbi:tetratricopeptide repeat protein [Hymenobacter puniceus]|uniref:tetratricopeptide repeat protein n=1 Tax=Hymenobacter sp. BT190 TaxID=2763505 RepID=UPI001650FA80|nr:tetratricopeptide repeat protein [Hymenobacter sp. BT190]MBC6699884.1 tetratricopeptide repeat protein [Hymenobacter sp. BT190]